jgi:hypothetical protein
MTCDLYELLEPFGWADITTRYPIGPWSPIEVIIDIQLKSQLASPGQPVITAPEVRAHYYRQAESAIKAIEDQGYTCIAAPEIQIGGSFPSGRLTLTVWARE